MLSKRCELYGESVFSSFRAYGGHVAGLDLHLERLRYAVSEYYLFRDLALSDFEAYFHAKDKIQELLCTAPDNYYRVTIYAGSSELSLQKEKFGLSELDIEIKCNKPSQEVQSLKLNTRDFHFKYLDTKIKAGSYFQNLQLKRQALNKGFSDSLLLDNGLICELSTSNVVVEKNGCFFAPKNENVFAGITLKLFEIFCKKNQVPFEFVSLPISEISEEDKVYALNSVQGVICIDKINELELVSQKSDFIQKFSQSLRKSDE